MKRHTTPFSLFLFLMLPLALFAQPKYDAFFEKIEENRQKGNYKEATRLNEEVILLVQKNLDSATSPKERYLLSETLANVMHNKGVLLLDMGEYENAFSYIKQSLEILNRIDATETPDYATFLDNLALIHQAQGNYADAEKLYNKSRDLRAKILDKRSPDYAISLNHLASLAHEMGDYKKAMDLYISSLNIIKKYSGTRSMEYATYQSNLATLYADIGSHDFAKQTLKVSIGILKEAKLEQHPDYAATLLSLANIEYLMERPKEAIALIDESIVIINKQLGEKHPLYTNALFQLGKVNQSLGNYETAENHYLRCLNIRAEILGVNHPDYTNLLVQLAQFYQLQGKKTQAESYYLTHLDKCLEQVQNYFSFLSEKEKENFYANLSENFEKFNAFAFQSHLENPALITKMMDYRLSTKAILFQSASQIRQQIASGENHDLVRLYKQWVAIKDRLARIYSPIKKLKVRILPEEIENLEKEANEIEKELAKQSATFQQFVQNQTVKWQNIQKSLKEKEASIEIIRFRIFDIQRDKWTDSINYIGLLINSQSQAYPHLVVLPNGKDLENKHFKAYQYSIKEKQTDDVYDYYWKPFATYLTDSSRVYISPDGVYNQLNINVLQNTETGNYLLDELDIYIVANMKEIIHLQEPPTTARIGLPKAVLVGRPNYDKSLTLNDLAGTEEEIRNIAEILKSEQWETEVYLGNDALESVIKQSNSPKVLHIASHGFFTSEQYADPMLSSGLMLTTYRNDTADDGLLTGYEAMGLSLANTDLVVLSACETGLGSIKIGEGVYGLQRAFKIAGAKNIMMSLWLADDWATQRLMKEFYKQWVLLGNQRQAFRVAQQKMREKYQHPYFWGAFVMWGG